MSRVDALAFMLLWVMAHPVPDPSLAVSTETAEQKDARLTWERARIAEGDADFAAGRFIGGDEALDWLDRWAAGEDLEDPAVA